MKKFFANRGKNKQFNKIRCEQTKINLYICRILNYFYIAEYMSENIKGGFNLYNENVKLIFYQMMSYIIYNKANFIVI